MEASLPAVPAGSYSLTVTDAAGCSTTIPALDIQQPPQLLVQTSISDIPCFGALTGKILTDVSGGFSPYTYQWSNGAVTPNALLLSASSYQLTVTDQTGCAQVLTDLTVKQQSEQIMLEVLEQQAVSCANAANGKIRVRVSNAQGPYQFAWTPPIGLHANVQQPEDLVSGLSGGIYRVTVTDAQGCYTVSPNLLVEEAPPLLPTIDSLHQVLCKGAHTGWIAASGAGGLPPYAWQWSNGNPNATAATLAAGAYMLTITDLQGCTITAGPVTITEPNQALSLQTIQVLGDVCGNSGGKIDIQPSGGTVPYQYMWSNGAMSQDLLGVPGGTYVLTLSDQYGCTLVSQEFQLSQNDSPLQITVQEVQDVACFGDSSGVVSLAGSGGVPPVYFEWNNGATGPYVEKPDGRRLLCNPQ
ncbi:MAG: SprB repeat-containing protein [Lewinellaceae bacterium]|nr:SprB repeat-containing protein [Lewinellaceae bacterium]